MANGQKAVAGFGNIEKKWLISSTAAERAPTAIPDRHHQGGLAVNGDGRFPAC